MPWHATFVCPKCSDRVMSPAIEQEDRLEFFVLMIRTTTPDAVFACYRCGGAPTDPEDRKRALFSGVATDPAGGMVS